MTVKVSPINSDRESRQRRREEKGRCHRARSPRACSDAFLVRARYRTSARSRSAVATRSVCGSPGNATPGRDGTSEDDVQVVGPLARVGRVLSGHSSRFYRPLRRPDWLSLVGLEFIAFSFTVASRERRFRSSSRRVPIFQGWTPRYRPLVRVAEKSQFAPVSGTQVVAQSMGGSKGEASIVEIRRCDSFSRIVACLIMFLSDL